MKLLVGLLFISTVNFGKFPVTPHPVAGEQKIQSVENIDHSPVSKALLTPARKLNKSVEVKHKLTRR